MSAITQELPQSAALDSPTLGTTLGRIHQTLRWAIAGWHTRRVVAGLSKAQLRDIGVDRSSVLGNKPVLVVDVGVETYLMSLR
jgi:hypothetical protein